MFYLVKTPRLLRAFYKECTWMVPGNSKTVYLTFDDGPHPEVTPFVLKTLKQYEAKASFFCIGKNVKDYPGIYQQIVSEGHTTGNHTYQHLDGWKTTDQAYLQDIKLTSQLVQSKFYRPPYGRIRKSQVNLLLQEPDPMKIIMWGVLSGDFDNRVTGEQCAKNVTGAASPGAIIVFHDSEKAKERITYALPVVMDFLAAKGYGFLGLNDVL